MSMRSFIAINLPEKTKRNLERLISEIKTETKEAKFVRRENRHLTLRFLGEISNVQLKTASSSLKKIAAKTPPFYLELECLLAFPDITQARILGVKVAKNNQLISLYEEIESEFNRLNIGKKEKRLFRPHITIARVGGRGENLGFIKGKVFRDKVRIKTIDLMKSKLEPSGAEYEIIRKFPLCQK